MAQARGRHRRSPDGAWTAYFCLGLARLVELAPVGALGTRVIVAPGPAGLRAELRTPIGPVVLD